MSDSSGTIRAFFEQRRGSLLLRAVSGSHAYGLATPQSDKDERGVFALSAREYLSLQAPEEHVQDERGDVVYLALRKFLSLAAVANPSALELLFTPRDLFLHVHPAGEILLAARLRFLTRRAIETHVGYAKTQIQRARGVNKWINNPQPESPPSRDDFCFVLDGPWPGQSGAPLPMRLKRLDDAGIDLREHHCSAVERLPGAYRLYHYGSEAKGVFRDGQLACESVPLQDELARFRGLLIFDKAGYERAKANHENYWQWRRMRNEARWTAQERGHLDYDAKNMMHTFRLLISAESILTRGEPLVRVGDADREFLTKIREGRFGYEDLVAQAEQRVHALTGSESAAALPGDPSPGFVDDLLRDVTTKWEADHA